MSRRFAWEEAARGIECKCLLTDPATDRVSMLVRLALAASILLTAARRSSRSSTQSTAEPTINERKLGPGASHRPRQSWTG